MQQRLIGLIYGAFDLGELRYVGKTRGADGLLLAHARPMVELLGCEWVGEIS